MHTSSQCGSYVVQFNLVEQGLISSFFEIDTSYMILEEKDIFPTN